MNVRIAWCVAESRGVHRIVHERSAIHTAAKDWSACEPRRPRRRKTAAASTAIP